MCIRLIIKDKLALEPELLAIALFLVAITFVTLLRPYLLLIIGLILTLYLIGNDLIKSLWLSFLVVMLFFKAKYFTSPVTFSSGFLDHGVSIVVKSYFIEFADALLLVLTYLVIRRRLFFKKLMMSIKLRLIDKLILGVLLGGILSSIFSPMQNIAWFSLWRLFKYILIYWVGREVLISKKIRKTSIEVIILFVIFNAGLIIVQKINGGPVGLPIESGNLFADYGLFSAESSSLYRPGGVTTSPNVMATMISMVLPMMLILGLTKNSYKKYWLWVGFFLSLIALIFTGARALWILMSIVLPLIGWWLAKREKVKLDSRKIRVAKWLIMVLLSLSVFSLVPRLMSLSIVFDKGESGFYRLRHLQIAKDFMLKYPFGLGLNVFQYQMVEEYDPDYFFYDSSPAHNLIAQVGSGLGLTSGVLLLWVYWDLIKEKLLNLIRLKNNPELLSVLLSMVIYLLISQIHPWLIERPMSGLFWVLAGFNYEKKV